MRRASLRAGAMIERLGPVSADATSSSRRRRRWPIAKSTKTPAMSSVVRAARSTPQLAPRERYSRSREGRSRSRASLPALVNRPSVPVRARLADAVVVQPLGRRALVAVPAELKRREPSLARAVDERRDGGKERVFYSRRHFTMPTRRGRAVNVRGDSHSPANSETMMLVRVRNTTTWGGSPPMKRIESFTSSWRFAGPGWVSPSLVARASRTCRPHAWIGLGRDGPSSRRRTSQGWSRNSPGRSGEVVLA